MKGLMTFDDIITQRVKLIERRAGLPESVLICESCYAIFHSSDVVYNVFFYGDNGALRFGHRLHDRCIHFDQEVLL